MKKFSNYVKMREEVNDMNFGHPNKEELDILYKLTKMAWERNRGEVKEFFGNLAENDADIKEIFKKLDNRNFQSTRNSNLVGKERDYPDEIAPPSADQSPGLDGGGTED